MNTLRLCVLGILLAVAGFNVIYLFRWLVDEPTLAHAMTVLALTTVFGLFIGFFPKLWPGESTTKD